MAISTEAKSFLEGLEREGGMSPDALKELRASLETNDKANTYVRESVLRQSDYSRNIAEAQKAKTAVEAATAQLTEKEAGLNKFQTELGTWKAGAEGNFKKALDERAKAEQKLATALGKLKTVAGIYGIDEAELLKDMDIVPPVDPNAGKGINTVDTSKFLTRDDIAKAERESALVNAMVSDIKDEHRELFGKSINGAQLVNEAIKAGKGVFEYWQETYKVGEKKTEMANAAINKRIADAVAAKEAEIRSTMPGDIRPRAGDANNPYASHKIFGNAKLTESLHKANEEAHHNEGESGVSAAVAAFQAGKYSTK